VALVAAPVAVLATAVALLVTVGNLGTGEPTGGGGGGGVAPTATARAGAEAAAVPSVAGPPGKVAALLRTRGFDAHVEGGTVVVTGASAAAVRRALASRAGGRVRVIVR
jgi:hypothetical protein